MRPVKLLIIILLLSTAARGTYVSSGKADFNGAFTPPTTTVCTPNSGAGVTIGNKIVMVAQSNDNEVLTISSPLVSSWTLDQSSISTITFYMWHGIATASGTASVTVSKATTTGIIGSACGEYTSPFSSSGVGTGSATTTGISGDDVIAFASSGAGGIAVTSPFTLRQNIDYVGTHYCAFADTSAGSTGNYTAAFTFANFTYILGQIATGATRHSHVIRYHLPNRRSPILFARTAWRKEGQS